MKVKPFKFFTEDGREAIVFLPISPLGVIAYTGEGTVSGWCFDAEPNTEVSYLVGEKLIPVKTIKELKQTIQI